MPEFPGDVGRPLNDFLDAARPSPFVEFISRRWVRITAIVWIVLTLGATIAFQTLVAPTLTADRFELWLAGSPDRVDIGVDPDADVVHITGGQNDLTELFIADDSILVLAADVDATTDATWIRVPLTALDPAFQALQPDRLADALSPGHVRCVAVGGDAAVILALLVSATNENNDGISLCGSGVGAAAEKGQDFFTTSDDVTPGEVAAVPRAGIVELADLDDPDATIELLDGLIGA
ncbi:MAG: hypothetical protein RL238_2162 [Actinomycetota bacterium]|jgi:hypothetical protein